MHSELSLGMHVTPLRLCVNLVQTIICARHGLIAVFSAFRALMRTALLFLVAFATIAAAQQEADLLERLRLPADGSLSFFQTLLQGSRLLEANGGFAQSTFTPACDVIKSQGYVRVVPLTVCAHFCSITVCRLAKLTRWLLVS